MNGVAITDGTGYPVEVKAGGTIHFAGISYGGSGSGTISIDYTDFAGLAQTVSIKGSVAGPGFSGPECGDGQCNGDESCATCPQDCTDAPCCGNGSCEATENCDACSADCGSCAVILNAASYVNCTQWCQAQDYAKCLSVGYDPSASNGEYVTFTSQVVVNSATYLTCTGLCQEQGYNSCFSIGMDPEGTDMTYARYSGTCQYLTGGTCSTLITYSGAGVNCPWPGAIADWTQCRCAQCMSAAADCSTTMPYNYGQVCYAFGPNPLDWTNCRCSN